MTNRAGPPCAVKVDDRELTVSITGDQRGWPVFLLHGTPGSRTGPKPRPSVLYRRGIKLICYDRPGYGGSSRDPGRRVVDAADDIIAIADDQGIDRFSIVGRSGGGPHALACAAQYPQRVYRAATLVSIAPNDPELDFFGGMSSDNITEYSAAVTNRQRLADRLRTKARRTRADPQSLLAELTTQMTPADLALTQQVYLQRQLAEAYAEALQCGADGWIDDVLALRSNWGFDLKSIEVPVRLWHGLEDNFAPADHTRWLAQQIPTAEVQLQPATAHFGAVTVLPWMLTWLAAGAETSSQPRRGTDTCADPDLAGPAAEREAVSSAGHSIVLRTSASSRPRLRRAVNAHAPLG